MPSRFDRYHTHRRSRRHPTHDYAQAAVYFVTVCTHARACLFGEVVAGQMALNDLGRLVDEAWRRSEAVRAEVVLDAFVVMPNHVHGLVVLAPPDADPATARDPRGYRLQPGARPQATPGVASSGRTTLPGKLPPPGSSPSGKLPPPGSPPPGPPPQSLGALMAGFKADATRRINAARGTPGAPVWQRNYHDHVVRTGRAWRRIRRYVRTNPARWPADCFHPDRL